MFVAVIHGAAVTVGEFLQRNESFIELQCEFAHLLPRVQNETFEPDDTLVEAKGGVLTVPRGDYDWVTISEATEVDVLDCGNAKVNGDFECMARRVGKLVFPQEVGNSVYAFYHANDVMPKRIGGRCELKADPGTVFGWMPRLDELVLLEGTVYALRFLYRCGTLMIGGENDVEELRPGISVFRDKLRFVNSGRKAIARF